MEKRGVVLFFILLGMGCMSHSSSNERSCDVPWDDSYATLISSARTISSDEESSGARQLLAGSTWNWANLNDYSQARAMVEKVSSASMEMIRLEVGNENSGSYDVVWFGRSYDKYWLVTNRNGPLRSVSCSEDSWSALVIEVEPMVVSKLESYVDSGVDDGTAHFLSVCLRGRSAQFAVYGLPLSSEVAPGQVDFAERVQEQGAVIRAVLRTADRLGEDSSKTPQ